MGSGPVFRANYYVGALLAQGGNLSLADAKIVFSPTSAIDRAMGARDVEISVQEIRAMEAPGGMSRTLKIKTGNRVHRFEGPQVIKFWEFLQTEIPKADVERLRSAASVQESPEAAADSDSEFPCDGCAKPLHVSFSFCPHCGAQPKAACASCAHPVRPTWLACAFCGVALVAKAA